MTVAASLEASILAARAGRYWPNVWRRATCRPPVANGERARGVEMRSVIN